MERGYREGIQRGTKGETEMKFMVPMQFLLLVLGGSTDSSVGRRDAYWASSGSAVTNSVLLSVL